MGTPIAKMHVLTQQSTNLAGMRNSQLDHIQTSQSIPIKLNNRKIQKTIPGLQSKIDWIFPGSCKVWSPLNFPHTIPVMIFANQLQVQMGLKLCQPLPGRHGEPEEIAFLDARPGSLISKMLKFQLWLSEAWKNGHCQYLQLGTKWNIESAKPSLCIGSI